MDSVSPLFAGYGNKRSMPLRKPAVLRVASAAAVATATAACGRMLARSAISSFVALPDVSQVSQAGSRVSSSLRSSMRQSAVLEHERAADLDGGIASNSSPSALGLSATLIGAAAIGGVAFRRRTSKVMRGPFRRDLSLEGYPIHGPGYYWTLQRDTEAVIVYVPIGDDVNPSDIVFNCRDGRLQLGMTAEKGGLIIDDELLYKVDIEESYYVIDSGEFGERCIACYVYKLTKEQDWYAYDRFDPVTERFLTVGEKERASLNTKVTHRTYFDVAIDGKPAGRFVIGLWGELVPKTAENFRCLCTGEKGKSEETGEPLHYKGTRFHRVIPGFCIQGGETFDDGEGSGGESIYGLTFEDENLRVKFKKPWMLAMANGGPDTNGSQFFILTNPADHLSHHCVGFGTVMEGRDVITAMEKCGTDDGEPFKEIVVTDCGELPMDAAA